MTLYSFITMVVLFLILTGWLCVYVPITEHRAYMKKRLKDKEDAEEYERLRAQYPDFL